MLYKFKIPFSVILISVLLATTYTILEFSYKQFIYPRYFYMGFNYNPSFKKILIAKGVFLSLLLFLNYFKRRSSFLLGIYTLLIFFFYLPNATLYALGNYPDGAFWSNVAFIATFLISPVLKFKLPATITPQKFRAAVIFLVPIMAIIPIILTFRSEVNTNNLLLKEIYETREVFSSKIAGFNNYLYNFLAKTFIPVGLIYFLIKRKYSLVLILSGLLLYLYVISGNKLVYLTTLLLVLFFYSGSSIEKKIIRFYFFTTLALLAFPILDLVYFSEPILTGIFINRFLFIPALLTQDYFDFFNGRPLLFAETHFLNFFSTSPYSKPVGYLISEIYFSAPNSYANNGIVSDGFMNLGYWGVGIFSVFFTVLFSLFNSFKLHQGYFGLFFSYIYILLSAPLFTCLITGGIIIFIFYSFSLLQED